MMRYVYLDLIFLAAAAAAWYFHRPDGVWPRLIITLIVLLAATAVFDNVMLGLHLFHYNAQYLLGVHLGKVPLEDFGYAVAAALLLPALWGKHS